MKQAHLHFVGKRYHSILSAENRNSYGRASGWRRGSGACIPSQLVESGAAAHRLA